MDIFELSPVQLQYLFYIKDYSHSITITRLSKHFNCSKVNSKKIVDKLISIGVIYKEKNDIKITKIGQNYINKYVDNRDMLIEVLNEGFNYDLKESKEIANKMILEDNEFISDKLLEVSQMFKALKGKRGRSFSSDSLQEHLGEGEYIINAVIFKSQEDESNSSMDISMSMNCFENKANLIIGEKSVIKLNVSPIIRVLNGIKNKGILREISYVIDGKRLTSVVKDSKCEIPFDIVKKWYYVGEGILQGGAWLEISANLNFLSPHKNRVNIFFTLNMFALNK